MNQDELRVRPKMTIHAVPLGLEDSFALHEDGQLRVQYK